MATQPRVRFQVDDIWDAPDDRRRREVIDGELHVATAPVGKEKRPGGWPGRSSGQCVGWALLVVEDVVRAELH